MGYLRISLFRFSITVAIFAVFVFSTAFSLAQSISSGRPDTYDSASNEATAPVVVDPPAAPVIGVRKRPGRPFNPHRFAVGLKASTFGPGIEFAMLLTRNSNLRFGFSAFDFSHDGTSSNVVYNADLNVRTFEFRYDWFPFGGSFHLSPALVACNGMRVKAGLYVPGGQTVSLGDGSYSSAASDPLNGTARVRLNRFGPSFTVGWGNLLPRSGKHFSVPVEVGFVFIGLPKATLNLTGSACGGEGDYFGCSSISSETEAQTDLQLEQMKLNRDISPLKLYPIISIGVGYSFGGQKRGE